MIIIVQNFLNKPSCYQNIQSRFVTSILVHTRERELRAVLNGAASAPT